MSRDRFYFGDLITYTDDGPVVDRIAIIIQRRISKNRKYTFLVIGCPYCGELHEHSEGLGYRVPHCPNRSPFSGEYFIMDNGQAAVPPSTPYPKLTLIREQPS